MNFAKCNLKAHQVQTDDGYILTVHRVHSNSEDVGWPYGPDLLPSDIKSDDGLYKDLSRYSSISTKPRPVALIVHGFQCSSSDWFQNQVEKTLPYKLISQGYDVWVANLRGTPLSKSHLTRNSSSSKFWNFGWHDMALYDLPALFDYILKTTGNDDLFYIGHSMGCSVFFACLALKPHLNAKVRAMIALAPAVYSDKFKNKPIRLIVAPVCNILGKFGILRKQSTGNHTLMGLIKTALPVPFLKIDMIGGWVMRALGRFMGSFGKNQVELERIARIAGQWPASTSTKTLFHGMQCTFAKRFQQYDYGRFGNFKVYGQSSPPLYELGNVTIPVATFHSEGDELCTSHDVTQLSKNLPNVIGNYGISDDGFGHADFMYGKDADKLVYTKVVDIFKSAVQFVV